jgi:AraC family transcriptional regulator of adaptative response/methylated-DNA-[protein]-cysteine methyltransferase
MGDTIRFAIGDCWLGSILVATSDRGLCAVLFGARVSDLARELRERFPAAGLREDPTGAAGLLAKVARVVEAPRLDPEIPLDLRGTDFQRRVWAALREVPSGSTISYSDLARRLGEPATAKDVGEACAANPIAVVVPCHRVVRKDGSLAGYRWGVARKRALLAREAASA